MRPPILHAAMETYGASLGKHFFQGSAGQSEICIGLSPATSYAIAARYALAEYSAQTRQPHHPPIPKRREGALIDPRMPEDELGLFGWLNDWLIFPSAW